MVSPPAATALPSPDISPEHVAQELLLRLPLIAWQVRRHVKAADQGARAQNHRTGLENHLHLVALCRGMNDFPRTVVPAREALL